MFILLAGTFSWQMLVQRLWDATLNKPLVMFHIAQKGLDLRVGLWWGKSGQRFSVFLAGSYTILGDMMSQVGDLVLEEFTLGWLELQVVLPDMLKHNMQALVPFPSMKRWSLHPGRSNSRSGSTHPDSSASVFGMWLGCYTAQTTCICIQRILCSAQ